jgi:hypothetical protein
VVAAVTKKTLYMETTEVSAERSAAEVSAVLIRAGATQIATEYEKGEIVGLRWTMRIAGRELLFAMPARVEPVYKIIHGRRDSYRRAEFEAKDRDQAKRVAWRQLLRWVQAQLAMVECGMTEAAEVFFPYLQTPSGNTIYTMFREQEFKMLPAGDPQ